MLTEHNYKDYVGVQEFKTPLGLVFMLCVSGGTIYADVWDLIQRAPYDVVLDHLHWIITDQRPATTAGMSIEKFALECTKTLDEALALANSYLESFPKTDRSESAAKAFIAKNSRRGMGNKRIGNVVLFRGSTEFDACMVIAKYNDWYGVYKHPHFERYGFVLNGGTQV